MSVTGWADRLKGLGSASALTIVGGNERNGTTRLLLSSVRHADCAFEGRINMVSRGADRVFDLPAVSNLAELEGDLGVGWLMTGPDNTLATLEAAGGRFDAVVVFGGGYGEVGNRAGQQAIATWSERTGVPVLGPQSVGFGYFRERRNFLDIMWKHPICTGPVGIVAHSGGILTALCGALMSRGPGVAAAFALGNEAVVDVASTIEALLEDDGVEIVVGYVEQFRSPGQLAAVAARAATVGKPLVLLVGGVTRAGQSMAASHTGALATPFRVVDGIAEQYGVVLVQTIDEVVDSVAALLHHGRRRFGRGRVGYFSNTQGLNVILVDHLSRRGLLPGPLSEATRAALPERPAPPANPYDAGAGKLGRPEEFVAQVATFLADPGVDIVCHQVHQQPLPAQAQHWRRLQDFNEQARLAGKPVVISFAQQEVDLVDDAEDGVSVAGGVAQAIAKVHALSSWSAAVPPYRAPLPGPVPAGPGMVLTGADAQQYLADVPLAWAGEITVPADGDLDALEGCTYPVVLKAETGDAHRAGVGAVLVGLGTPAEAAAGIAYLRARFGSAVTVCELVPHDVEFFIGLSRTDDGYPLLAMGSGGATLGERAHLRLLPLTDEQGAALVEKALPDSLSAADAAGLVAGLQRVMARPDVIAVDLNPVVVRAGRLVVLDGKVHVTAGGDPR